MRGGVAPSRALDATQAVEPRVDPVASEVRRQQELIAAFPGGGCASPNHVLPRNRLITPVRFHEERKRTRWRKRRTNSRIAKKEPSSGASRRNMH